MTLSLVVADTIRYSGVNTENPARTKTERRRSMSSGMPIWMQLYQAIGWIYLLMMVIGFVVAIRYRHLSRFMYLVTIGMAGIAGASFISRVGSLLFNLMATNRAETIQYLFMGMTCIGAFSWGLFVFGLAAVFRDLKFQIEMLEDCLPQPPPTRQ